MFAAVMQDPENCRLVLERVLSMKISRVVVYNEESMIFHPDYKGVRLDIYAEDEENTHYNVEMQVASTEVCRRSRYYHGQMDSKLLSTGVDYDLLPESYVIFICDFDPFNLGKYRYTVNSCFTEDMQYNYSDGSHTIFLNTKGRNDDEVPPELVKFLKFTGANLENSTSDFNDDLVSRIQTSINTIKKDREIGDRYMVLQKLLKDEHSEGYKEGHEEGHNEGYKEGIIKTLKDNIQSVINARDITLSQEETESLASIDDSEKLKTIFNLAIAGDMEALRAGLRS